MVATGLCLLAGFAVYANIVDTASDAPGIISVGLNRLLSAPTLPPPTSAGRPHDDEAVYGSNTPVVILLPPLWSPLRLHRTHRR
ncbi:MAG: hypothetical protein H0X47_04920 [Nitrospirales bacterium]|nr:hypothetical protein [Nitrospirales bacterium]